MFLLNDPSNNQDSGVLGTLEEDTKEMGEKVKEEAHKAKEGLYDEARKVNIDPEHVEDSPALNGVKEGLRHTEDKLKEE
jgi:hypothetical protein